MKFLFDYYRIYIAFAVTASAAPVKSGPFASPFSKRQSSDLSLGNLTVDLGYEVYQGYYDSNSKLNSWKG